jgi:peptidoglycan/LPS O-acetylase OafA/YrhL
MGDDHGRRGLTYAPALDGLRAIACLSVMLYHAKYLRGGFLGVDVFFTLSGFLITSLLLEELRGEDGAVDLRAFWRRRIYRIVPLLATVSVTLFVWASAHGGAAGQTTVIGALSSLLFVVNWVASHQTQGGGALTANWSVAMEEQFYLVWPLVLSLLYRWRRSERAAAAIIGAAAIALAVHRFVMVSGTNYTRVWFGIDTQADAVLAGCAVALGWRCRSRIAGALGAVGLVAILVFARETAFTLRWLLPATTICTALVVPVLAERRGWLAWSPLRAIGRRSYGLYLWGSAINYLALDVYGLHGRALVLVVFPATFLVTEMTYRLVELPLRQLGRRPVRRSPASGTVPGGRLRLSLRRP